MHCSPTGNRAITVGTRRGVTVAAVTRGGVDVRVEQDWIQRDLDGGAISGTADGPLDVVSDLRRRYDTAERAFGDDLFEDEDEWLRSDPGMKLPA